MRKVCNVLNLILFFVLLNRSVIAQESTIFDRLNSESALVVVLNELDSFSELIESVGKSNNAQLLWKLITDENHGFVNPDQSALIIEKLGELTLKLESIEEVVLVVHEVDKDWNIEASLLINAAPGIIDELFSLSDLALKLIPDENPDQPLSWNNHAHSRKSGDRWLIISNRENFQFSDNIPIRSFSNSRKFKRVSAYFKQAKRKDEIATIVANPNKLHFLFPKISDELWASYQVKDFPSLGAKLRVGSRDNDKLNLLVECVITMVQPPTDGLSAIIASKKEIASMPPLVGSPFFLTASSFDPRATHDAREKLFENAYPEKNFNEVIAEQYKHISDDYTNDILPRTDFTIEYNFVDDQQESKSLTMERIASAVPMKRYVNGLVKFVNSLRRKSDKISEMPTEFGTILTVGVDSEQPGRTPEGHEEQSYFVGDQWYVTGKISGIMLQLENFQQFPRPTTELDSFMAVLNNECDTISSPYRIEFRGARYWKAIGSTYEYVRITEKYKGAPDSSLDKALQRTPDENGFTLKIDSREDLIALIQKQIFSMFAESFGNQLFLLNRNDSRLQFIGGFFKE